MIAALTSDTVSWCQVSTLNFVDLAGSERSTLAAKDDGDNKLRQTEGSAINKSLLTLGNVIRGLGDGRVSATRCTMSPSLIFEPRALLSCSFLYLSALFQEFGGGIVVETSGDPPLPFQYECTSF